MRFILILFSLAAASSAAELVVVRPGSPVPEAPGVEVFVVRGQPDLESLAARCGARPGVFPALVDTGTGIWSPLADGLEAARAALAARVQEKKSGPRTLLENEWFDLVDEIALAAGDPPPAEADAKDLGKVRAKLKKAKDAKDAASGAGKKAKADDLLELSELRGRLLLLDAELSAEDPGWKKNAKRHSVP